MAGKLRREGGVEKTCPAREERGVSSRAEATESPQSRDLLGGCSKAAMKMHPRRRGHPGCETQTAAGVQGRTATGTPLLAETKRDHLRGSRFAF
jgi:hypothetical protein